MTFDLHSGLLMKEVKTIEEEVTGQSLLESKCQDINFDSTNVKFNFFHHTIVRDSSSYVQIKDGRPLNHLKN